MDIEEYVQKGFLRKIKIDKKLIQKEFDEVRYDLSRAKMHYKKRISSGR